MAEDTSVSPTFRPKYRALSDEEMRVVEDIKVAATILELHIKGDGHGSRYQSLALTALEESVMWAVKHVTT